MAKEADPALTDEKAAEVVRDLEQLAHLAIEDYEGRKSGSKGGFSASEPSVIKIQRLMHEKGSAARAANDKSFAADFHDIADDIGSSFDFIGAMIDHDPPLPDNALMGVTMNWGVLNTLLSAVELFRLGYYKEPMMLVRNAIETACVAHVITADEASYKEFIKDPNKFDSPKAVGKAKKVVGVLGGSYGLLSNYFTHPGGLHVLPHEVKDATLYIGGYMGDDKDGKRARLAVIMLKQSISSIGMLIQVPNIWGSRSSRYWEIQKDGKTCAGKPATEKARKELDEMADLLGIKPPGKK